MALPPIATSPPPLFVLFSHHKQKCPSRGSNLWTGEGQQLMNKYNDYKPTKEQGSGGGFRRFIFLLLAMAFLAFMVAAWTGGVVTEKHGGDTAVVTTVTPGAGVAVHVQQSAPAVSVAIEQAPAPPTNDNTVALLAYQNADKALSETKGNYELVAQLYPRVAALETAVAAPPTPSTELQLLRFDVETNRMTTTILTAGFFFLLALLMAVTVGISWLTSRPRPTPPATPQHQLSIGNDTPHHLHGADTVQHGTSTVLHQPEPVQRTTSGSIPTLTITNRRPEIPKAANELTTEHRRYIQHTYNRLRTYSGTCRHIWGYHNAATLTIVKSVVGEGANSPRLQ
jgi:hypothetical protein